MPIRTRYEKQLQEIISKLTQMCRLVELAIEKSVKALIKRDHELAQEVCDGDKQIDEMEREIEQACLKILVMEHPVASDFREISTALKMITDLERIGDQARDIAEITLLFPDEKYIRKLEHIPQMATIAIQMVKDGVQAYINHDLKLARALRKVDDEVDALFDTIKTDLTELLKTNPDYAEQAILFMMIAKYLERIGDHAGNISEWVEYAITGKHHKSYDNI